MTEPQKDLGIAMALLTRFNEQRLPRALALKEKVGRGERLDEWDLTFLREVLETAEQIQPFVDHHPEYQELYARAAALYQEIKAQALKNETGSGASA